MSDMIYLMHTKGMTFLKIIICSFTIFTYHEEATVTPGLLKEQQQAGAY